MKTHILIAFIFWMIFTIILALSIVGGLFLLTPQQNNTMYHMEQSELRSTWMRIGYSLKEKLMNS